MDIETERAGDYLIRIVLDEDPMNPRDMTDCLANMVLHHRNYSLPNDIDFNFESVDTFREMAEVFRDEYGARVILPVFISEYSGGIYTRSTNRDSDNSQIGFIFATDAQIREWHGLTPDAPITPEIEFRVRDGLRAEVAEYDAWARGEVYGYVIETATTTYKVEPSDDLMGSARIVAIPPGEEVDSCWGFVGDTDYCMSAARDAVPV